MSDSQTAYTEQCGLCGSELAYLEEGMELTCAMCGRTEVGHVSCPEGHYLCESCHGAGIRELLPRLLAASDSTSPSELAERILTRPELPMLGCEHALIAAGSLMTALKNRGDLGVTQDHVNEALERTKRQAISAYCGLTGVCGIVPALGACYSVLVGGQCGKGPETRAAMKLVSRLAAVTAEEAAPGCCKAFLRSCLAETEVFLQERLGIEPSGEERMVCRDITRHPHGCRGVACAYHPDHVPESEQATASAAGLDSVLHAKGACAFAAAAPLEEAVAGG